MSQALLWWAMPGKQCTVDVLPRAALSARDLLWKGTRHHPSWETGKSPCNTENRVGLKNVVNALKRGVLDVF